MNPQRSPDNRLAYRALALGLLGFVTIVSFRRSISGANWVLPAAGAAWLGIAITLTLRRIGLWTLTSVLASWVVAFWFITVTLLPETSFFLIPSGRSLQVMRAVSLDALARIARVTPPVRPDAGYMTLLMGAAWMAGSMSAGLLRTRVSYSCTLPWIIVFAASCAVGMPTGRRFHLVIFMIALFVVLLIEAFSEEAWTKAWVGAFGRVTGRGRVLPRLRSASQMGVISLLGAISLPAILPGYSEPALVPWRDPGGAARVEISPFVQIRPRLTSRVERVLFTVRSNRPSYWRLTSLNSFDGNTWELKGNFSQSSGPIRLSRPPLVKTITVRQQFHIEALGGSWVPSAYAPTRVQGLDVLVDPVRDTMLTSRLEEGQRFDVVSAVPQATAQQLEAAESGGVGIEFVRLPRDLNPRIFEIAREWTADATSDYSRALAIQTHLRRFRYNESVPQGHSDDYLVEFLTEFQAGYCEQFAGAMAVLLRAIGISSRVAVGFLPGRASGDEYSVTTKDAHAWTEAYFENVGWVAFEPTPPRATGDSADDVQPAAEAPADGTTPGAASPRSSRPLDDQGSFGSVGRDSSTGFDVAKRASERLALAVGAILLMLALSRQLIFRGSHLLVSEPDTAGRARAAFNELFFRAQDAVRPRHASETEAGFVSAVARELRIDPESFIPVIQAFQKAEYSAADPTRDDVHRSLTALRRFRRELWKSSPWWARLRLAFSARPLISVLQRAVRTARSMRASSAARKA